MMGGGGFILLKTGRSGPESTKQAEIRLAGLPKILNIYRSGNQNPLAEGRKHMQWLYGCGFPPGMANWSRDGALCYPDHSFSGENGAVSCNAVQG